MSLMRERGKHNDGQEWEHFSIKWDFVNTYLSQVAVDDPERLLRDLIDLERAMNK